MVKLLIYDCETKNCVPDEGDWRDLNLSYCAGWHDFENMGISTIAVYAYWQDLYHIYLQDNLGDFQLLLQEADEVIGFNSLAFDDKLCQANGIEVVTTYDLLQEIRVATGQPAEYTKGVTLNGYSLDRLSRTNLQTGKSLTGSAAPVLYQQGKVGQLVSYALRDIGLTRRILELGLHKKLKDPNTQESITLKWSEGMHYLDRFLEARDLKEKLTAEEKKVLSLTCEKKNLEQKLQDCRVQYKIKLTALNLLLSQIDDDCVRIQHVVTGMLNGEQASEF